MWFLIHIREEPFDIVSDVYVYLPSDFMFNTNSEFAVNQRHMIAHLLYDWECLLIIGLCCRYTSSLQRWEVRTFHQKVYNQCCTLQNAREIIQTTGRPPVFHSACRPNYNGGDAMYLSDPATVCAVVHRHAGPAILL